MGKVSWNHRVHNKIDFYLTKGVFRWLLLLYVAKLRLFILRYSHIATDDIFKLLFICSRYHQTHYEQMGHIEGSVTIDGKTQNISMPCVRDHSFGKSVRV